MRSRGIAAAAGVLLAAVAAGVAWWAWPQRAARDGAAGASRAPYASSPMEPAPAGDAAPVAGRATRTLSLTLRATGGATPDPARIEAGLARIDPADLAALAVEGDESVVESGPESLGALANVERWVRVPGERTDGGDVRAGPVPGAADRVRLIARGGGLAYYAADVDPDDPPLEILPRFASGVRVRVAAGAGPIGIAWHPAGSPVGASGEASLWQDVLARMAPDVLGAARDRPLRIEREHVIAPLPPGATIELVASVDGIEAERRTVTLVPGRIVDASFDAAPIAAARELGVELALEIVARDSGQPLAFADLLLQRPEREESQRTDVTGRATFRAVDRRTTHVLTIRAPASADPLPLWPTQHIVEVAIETDEGLAPARRVERRVEVDALRYIVLALPRDTAARLARLAEPPYPVFALERAQDAGWQDTASEHFVPLDEGMAVSVAGTGRFRVLVATSPWHLLRSQDVVLADGSPRRVDVTLVTPIAAARTLTVLDDGVPLRNHRFTLGGPHRSLPPQVRASDASGRLALGPANVERIAIDLPHRQSEAVVALDRNEIVVEISGDRATRARR